MDPNVSGIQIANVVTFAKIKGVWRNLIPATPALVDLVLAAVLILLAILSAGNNFGHSHCYYLLPAANPSIIHHFPCFVQCICIHSTIRICGLSLCPSNPSIVVLFCILSYVRPESISISSVSFAVPFLKSSHDIHT